ncbi:cytochrome c biogenesis protein CcdC [Caldibacillus lycopersici]|uniref:Cytochrome c biogenesis protein CcdC n=1 Tax=Perspicuibacillus lycopersici TaxID=1325689 RepID=A0AAE3IPF1_9BACI|nr:cytochrome c biogenesis protein CcdC [Perspicuibacillus lycopersici]MCU9611956.1 cytochrome c biogenesis protein CcdC [Perspicuibacillus lycopersici]
MEIVAFIFALFMSVALIFIRSKASDKPASVKKILIPPVMMSTGALMYIFPMFRLNLMEMLEAVVLGLFFSIFLIKTSGFEVVDSDIYLKKSKAFIFILIGLLVIRTVLKYYLSDTIDYGELAGMFWLLAFAMIVPWRVAMFMQYRKIAATLH